ncbi:MAG: hypothetical protein ABIJ10_04955 [Candidatus Micrarchaeota archaeon]
MTRKARSIASTSLASNDECLPIIPSATRGSGLFKHSVQAHISAIVREFEAFKEEGDCLEHSVFGRRAASSLLAIAVFARELDISFDTAELFEVANTNWDLTANVGKDDPRQNPFYALNWETRQNLGLANFVLGPKTISDHIVPDCFEDPKSELLATSADFRKFFVSIYMSIATGYPVSFSDEETLHLLGFGAEMIAGMRSFVFDDKYQFMGRCMVDFNTVLIGLLAISKQFDNFRVPPSLLEDLFDGLVEHEKISNMDTIPSLRTFMSKILLLVLHQLNVDAGMEHPELGSSAACLPSP